LHGCNERFTDRATDAGNGSRHGLNIKHGQPQRVEVMFKLKSRCL